jgi:hypothetical protein
VGRVAFKKGGDPLGWQPCLCTPLMHRVLPPSEPLDGERPRCFRLAVVGGTQLRGSWYLSAIARLQGLSSSMLGRGVRRVGACLRASSGPLLPSVIGGKGVRRSWRWQLPRVWLSGLSGSGAASGATSHRGSRRRFLCRRDSRCHPRSDLRIYDLGSLSSPLEWGHGRGPYRSSVCLEVIAAAVWPAGAEVVVAAAGVGIGEPPRVLSPCRPSNVGGCSYLRGWNQSSICNGTLSAGVCPLQLSGPEHVCIWA